MGLDEAEGAEVSQHSYLLKATTDEFDQWRVHADLCGYSLAKWIRVVLNGAAHPITGEASGAKTGSSQPSRGKRVPRAGERGGVGKTCPHRVPRDYFCKKCG